MTASRFVLLPLGIPLNHAAVATVVLLKIVLFLVESPVSSRSQAYLCSIIPGSTVDGVEELESITKYSDFLKRLLDWVR